MTTWPPAQVIESRRVQLAPVAVSDAAEMVPVLADPALYEFIGGRPPTLEQLERRYAAQSVGHSEDRSQWWLNWIVRLSESREAVGYVQATVEDDRSMLEASIAWVIAPQFQRRGLGSEATSAMVDWLRNAGSLGSPPRFIPITTRRSRWPVTKASDLPGRSTTTAKCDGWMVK